MNTYARTREWAIAVSDMIALVLGEMWKILELWARKEVDTAVELNDLPDGSLEDSSDGSYVGCGQSIDARWKWYYCEILAPSWLFSAFVLQTCLGLNLKAMAFVEDFKKAWY